MTGNSSRFLYDLVDFNGRGSFLPSVWLGLVHFNVLGGLKLDSASAPACAALAVRVPESFFNGWLVIGSRKDIQEAATALFELERGAARETGALAKLG